MSQRTPYTLTAREFINLEIITTLASRSGKPIIKWQGRDMLTSQARILIEINTH